MPSPVRPDGVKPVVLSLEKEALEILHALAPSRKAHGHFLSRLLFEHRARQEARAERQARTGEAALDPDIARLYGLPVQDEAVQEPRTRLARQAGAAVDADIAMVYGVSMAQEELFEQ